MKLMCCAYKHAQRHKRARTLAKTHTHTHTHIHTHAHTHERARTHTHTHLVKKEALKRQLTLARPALVGMLSVCASVPT